MVEGITESLDTETEAVVGGDRVVVPVAERFGRSDDLDPAKRMSNGCIVSERMYWGSDMLRGAAQTCATRKLAQHLVPSRCTRAHTMRRFESPLRAPCGHFFPPAHALPTALVPSPRDKFAPRGYGQTHRFHQQILPRNRGVLHEKDQRPTSAGDQAVMRETEESVSVLLAETPNALGHKRSAAILGIAGHPAKPHVLVGRTSFGVRVHLNSLW